MQPRRRLDQRVHIDQAGPRGNARRCLRHRCQQQQPKEGKKARKKHQGNPVLQGLLHGQPLQNVNGRLN